MSADKQGLIGSQRENVNVEILASFEGSAKRWPLPTEQQQETKADELSVGNISIYTSHNPGNESDMGYRGPPSSDGSCEKYGRNNAEHGLIWLCVNGADALRNAAQDMSARGVGVRATVV